jgi:predicted  nucleic acid-binding Zn-ribbon protein
MAVWVLFSSPSLACNYGVRLQDALNRGSQIDSEPQSSSDLPSTDLAQSQEDSAESCQLESRGELDLNLIAVEELASDEVEISAPERISFSIELPDHLITLPGTPPPACILG